MSTNEVDNKLKSIIENYISLTKEKEDFWQSIKQGILDGDDFFETEQFKKYIQFLDAAKKSVAFEKSFFHIRESKQTIVLLLRTFSAVTNETEFLLLCYVDDKEELIEYDITRLQDVAARLSNIIIYGSTENKSDITDSLDFL